MLALSKKNTTYFVYLLRCCDDTLYCGITTDIDRRIKQHNGELAGGAKYTRAKRPVKLVHSEICKDLQEAMSREYEIKKWKKIQKEAFVKKVKTK